MKRKLSGAARVQYLMRYWLDLFKDTYSEWSRHEAPRLGAAIAYYTILSMAPLLIVVIAIIGMALGKEAAEGQIMAQIQGLVGRTGAEAIQTAVANSNQPAKGVLASILALATLFLGASGVFVELRGSLNRIWDAPPKPEEGFMATIRDRFLSFGMVVGIGFVLLVSLVISAGMAAASKFVGGYLPMPPWLLQSLNFAISLMVFAGVFALVYRVLPDEPIEWRETIVGAVFTAILFVIGKFLIGLYLGQASTASAYGAAGSLVVVLIWVYYSAQIFFFGAEFTHVYALREGKHSSKMAAGNAVMTVPVKVTGDGTEVGVADQVRQEAAAGGAVVGGGGEKPQHASIWLTAALGGLVWWRGRGKKGAPSR